ncbi:MAG: phage portal protein, partial [Anaerotignum sp.]|nr:phage portal protein [Anaerotignum sp.]
MALFFRKKNKKAEKQEERAEEKKEIGVTAEDALLSAMLGGGGMTRDKIMEIPTVCACIEKLAGTVASLPIKLYRIGEDGRPEEVNEDERLALLNRETGDTLNAYEFWLNMVEDYYLGKGAYAFINKELGRFKSIHHVEDHKVSILKNEDPIFKSYLIQVNGATYLPHEFLKIRRRASDGFCGKALHEEKPLIFAIAYATMIFERSSVQKGGNKRGFIEAEHKLSQASMDAIKDAWSNLYSNDSDRV